MKEAGIREARQNLTALIEEVRKGHEVTIRIRVWIRIVQAVCPIRLDPNSELACLVRPSLGLEFCSTVVR